MLLFCHGVAFGLPLQVCVCVSERGRELEKIPVNVFVLRENACEVSRREKKGIITSFCELEVCAE